MAHYRKIDVHIWNDAKFASLSHAGKLIFLFLVTHPAMTSLGAVRATTEGLAAELKMEQEVFLEAFGEVLAKAMAKHDRDACCIWLPNFLKYQSAESPNVIKNWIKQIEFIPEGTLKSHVIAGLKDYVEGKSEGFRKAFLESFPEDYRDPVSSKQRAVIPSQSGGLPSQGDALLSIDRVVKLKAGGAA